jgi:hypothetical protein
MTAWLVNNPDFAQNPKLGQQTAQSLEVPHQYQYNPRLWDILLLFGSGFLWIAVYWLPRGHIPTGFHLWESLIGLIPIAWALIVGVRRIWVERYLLLDNDSMVLPIGMFQMQTAEIEYRSIRRVWRHSLTTHLCSGWRPKSGPLRLCPAFFQTTRAITLWKSSLTEKLSKTRARKSPQETSY